MKSLIILIAVLIVGTASFAQTKTTTTHRHGTKTQPHKHSAKKYTCPMHPGVVRSRPGKCPKCNMKLIAVKKTKPASTTFREDKPMYETK